MDKRFDCHVRKYRRKSGLGRAELAYLLGYKSGSAIVPLERGQSQPSLETAIACCIIFDATPEELFPGLFSDVEWRTLERAWNLHQRIEGVQSAAAKAAALHATIERIKVRSEQHDG